MMDKIDIEIWTDKIKEYEDRVKFGWVTDDNVNQLCQSLGFSNTELVETLMRIVEIERHNAWRGNCDFEYMREALEKKEENGRSRQQLVVSAGLPIARKSVSAIDIELCMRSGMTDKQIMEEYNISRSTLWRRKKKIEKYKRSMEQQKAT